MRDLSVLENWSEFRRELQNLINYYGIDSELNTPDFVLARFCEVALRGFKEAVDASNTLSGVYHDDTLKETTTTVVGTKRYSKMT